jgi:hypothetical protein
MKIIAIGIDMVIGIHLLKIIGSIIVGETVRK